MEVRWQLLLLPLQSGFYANIHINGRDGFAFISSGSFLIPGVQHAKEGTSSQGLIIMKETDVSPPNMPFWFKIWFELKALEKEQE